MGKKSVIVLALALIFGAITAIAVNRILKQQKESSDLGELANIVVAVSPISVGQKITADQVRLEKWPKRILPEGAVGDIAEVVDRVALAEVAIGEPILKSRLAPEGSAAGLAAVIPPGMRAMTVKVDEVIGVAGFVAPGTYVDVVATATPSLGESTSRIILQNVKVLASGKQIENGRDGGPVEVKTVTLQVTPEQAEALALASTAGRLQLVMRSSVDQNEVPTDGVDTAELFGKRIGRGVVRRSRGAGRRRSKPKAEKPAPPPPSATVELIRGTQRTTVTFQ